MRVVLWSVPLALAALGCSGSSPYSSSASPVSGKVLAPSGEVVKGGAQVVLTPKSTDKGVFGKEGTGEVKADGTFSLKTNDGQEGLPGGTYTVVVRPFGANNTPEKQAAARLIPKKYWSDESSDMTVEITSGKTDWELKLPK